MASQTTPARRRSDLFARQDYRSTTTREIAEAAGVTESLLFRHFGSKAALFREALVLPFTSFVDNFGQTWQAVVPEETDEDVLARHFVGQLYDVFVEHRGLIVTLLASDALSDEEWPTPALLTSGGLSASSATSAPRVWISEGCDRATQTWRPTRRWR